jgi:nucleoside-diphosphate-sugar epimerase
VKKFLMVSYIASRKSRAPWWTDEDWASALKFNNEILPDYAKAKIAADEMLTALSLQRKDFQGICLRPGTLSADPPTGKVTMGHTSARGQVTRADVADVAVRLLEEPGARGRFDLLNGEEAASDAVKRVVRDGIDCTEGEDIEAILNAYKL